MARLVAAALLLSLTAAAISAEDRVKVNDLCSAASQCGRNAFCALGHCQCVEGHLPWMGDCLPVRTHGEKCRNQIECTFSRDPNLKCTEFKHLGETVSSVCLCRPGYEHSKEAGRCRPEGDKDVAHKATREHERPEHIGLPKEGGSDNAAGSAGTAKGEQEGIVAIERNLNAIYYGEKASALPTEAKVLGPVSIAVAGMLLFGICVCFWSVRNPDERPEDTYAAGEGGADGPSDAEAPTYRSAKNLEDGLSVGPGHLVQAAMGSPHPDSHHYHPHNGTLPHDNAAFQPDNADALSHFTTQTEVCDASHVEYIDRTGEVLQRDAAAVVDPSLDAGGYDHNIKMIFKHSQEVSLTPSMDEADVEVAGIYKTFSSNVDPLAARIENLPTPPPNVGGAAVAADGKKRVIELVETDDCTSIDTTIPEDEIAQFQRGLERQKELNLDDSIKEETEEELDRHNSEESGGKDSARSSNSGSSSEEGAKAASPSTPPATAAAMTPRMAAVAKECSDFVDNAFKPVFSIS